MGIQGLLKVLKPYTHPVHIGKYSGTRIGIDAYCWLHKGAYACSFDLCERGQNATTMQPCINYCMHRINLLRFHNIIPVVVFDGGRLPFKGTTETERQKRRDQNLETARRKLSQGDVKGAVEFFQRAVEITPYMAYELIKVLRSEDVEFVVAPYEADAQLAYLSTLSPENGGIVAVISEDSDLLAYGCDVVIFKMDKYGNGEEIKLSNVMQKISYSQRPSQSLSFGSFTLELFTGMCVLAGCDFLPSVAGIGIKRAHGLVSKYRDLSRRPALHICLNYAKSSPEFTRFSN